MEATEKHWVLGSAALGLLLLTGTWVLAISPTLDAAAATHADVASVRDRNEMLRAQLDVLRQRGQDLPRYQTDIATLREQIPGTADAAAQTERIAGWAEAHGITIVDLSYGTPLDVVPPARASGAGQDAPGAAGGDASVPGATPAAAPADDRAAAGEPVTATEPTGTGVAIPGFVAVPVEIVALAPTTGAIAFLEDLQADTSRLFLVTALGATGQGDAPASGGRPATSAGDVELTVSGYVYVLRDASSPGAPTSDDASTTQPVTPTDLPAPDPLKERFSPPS